jgi:hypothetical protein
LIEPLLGPACGSTPTEEKPVTTLLQNRVCTALPAVAPDPAEVPRLVNLIYPPVRVTCAPNLLVVPRSGR